MQEFFVNGVFYLLCLFSFGMWGLGRLAKRHPTGANLVARLLTRWFGL